MHGHCHAQANPKVLNSQQPGALQDCFSSAAASNTTSAPAHRQLPALGQAVDEAGRRGAAHAVQREAGLGEELGAV